MLETPEPTAREIIDFLGKEGKTTQEISKRFNIPYNRALALVDSVPKVRYARKNICRPRIWFIE